MAAANPILCCYSLNGFDGCIAGCVTLATRLFLSVAPCEFIKYIRLFEETAFLLLGAYNGDIPVQICFGWIYRQTSNIGHTLLGDTIVDYSDIVGASPVGAVPTASSFST